MFFFKIQSDEYLLESQQNILRTKDTFVIFLLTLDRFLVIGVHQIWKLILLLIRTANLVPSASSLLYAKYVKGRRSAGNEVVAQREMLSIHRTLILTLFYWLWASICPLPCLPYTDCVDTGSYSAVFLAVSLFKCINFIQAQLCNYNLWICPEQGFKITGGHHCGGETFQSIFSRLG